MNQSAIKPTIGTLVFLSSSLLVVGCTPAPPPQPPTVTEIPVEPSSTSGQSEDLEPVDDQLGELGADAGRLGGQGEPGDGGTVVSGRLPPEVIQRIVRKNYGQFRKCYQDGMKQEPNLQLRVVVRFVIGRDGTTTNVVHSHSGIQPSGADSVAAGVGSCVTGAFKGLKFPQPEGGIVTVAYPVHFTPSP